MSDKPYDEYVDRAVSGLVPSLTIVSQLRGKIVGEEKHFSLSERDLRSLLADAWLAGLAYSLNLIEGEKERRNVHKSKTSMAGSARESIYSVALESNLCVI
jgi:hypothetical protein